MWKLVPALTREMGQAYPELIRAEALITETLKLEETRFRKTLERGLAHSRRGKRRRSKQGRHVRRRDRLHALRHLRLSARSDAGRAARARHRRRPRRVQRRDGAPARRRRAPPGPARARPRPRRSGSRLREKVGATEFLGYETESAEGVVAALVTRRQGGRRAEDRRERRRGDQPDAVLRRVRRPGRRHRRDARATACAARVTDTQKKAGDLFVHLVKVEQGTLKVGDRAAARGRSRAPRARSGRTIPPPICCTRRCARCSAITWRRRARWSRPTGCASTSRIPSR